jgi:RNA 2',3'-cyclic 3'-phosphodiesterase
MRETTRTFIAIPIPEPIEKKLVRRQSELTPKVTGCRWTSGLPFHITLAFLGDVRNNDLNALCLAVASAVESFGPFELQLEGLGAFPSEEKPRVIWAGVTPPNPNALLDLREAVVESAARVGYRTDDPRFHPHVTLGRIKSERGSVCDLTRVVERGREWSLGSFSVSEVVTYASTFEEGGLAYAPLGRCRLKGQKTGPSH